ncbi:MAG TPA: lyase family protein, partial [Chthonomonadales bacterium]|nr:lyase family protein [Chthonomonadales bacterium]
VTTGSSIMPQKKNPDVAELTRGKAGRVFGSLVALLTVMKGLPLSYNKDLQEDKEPLFDAAATLRTVLPAFRQMLSTASFVKPKMAEAATGDFSTATDLADYLVRQGMPFRQAHEVVGKVVQRCLSQGVALESLGAEGLKELLADAGQSLEPDVLTVSHSVATRNSAGGTGPTAVLQQVAAAEKALALN